MCGVFGIYGHSEAANLTYLGLSSLQHRGQEASGIGTFRGDTLKVVRRQGIVSEGFNREAIDALAGDRAIGHIRYSTSGGSFLRNAQPLSVNYRHGDLAVAHNGNLLGADTWRARLEELGAIFQSTTDTEILIHLMARSHGTTLRDRVIDALSRVRGAYSILFLGASGMVAARDPWGYRPLVMGELDGATVFASETCAFSLIGARLIRAVEPGEVIWVTDRGTESIFPFETPPHSAGRSCSQCIFEHVYFARPDSHMFGHSVYETRVRSGRILAKEHPVAGDIVIPVPDSGIATAIGYSEASNIPFGMGLIRSHYVGRTFIEPSQSIRSFGVKLKLSPVADILRGRSVVVVDDSLVRGTTSRKIIEMIRAAGAREIHLRIGAPPVTHSCFYGIDTPTREELIASSKSVEETARFVRCDSLGYISREGLLKSVNDPDAPARFCTACFDGNYPEDPAEEPPRVAIPE